MGEVGGNAGAGAAWGKHCPVVGKTFSHTLAAMKLLGPGAAAPQMRSRSKNLNLNGNFQQLVQNLEHTLMTK